MQTTEKQGLALDASVHWQQHQHAVAFQQGEEVLQQTSLPSLKYFFFKARTLQTHKIEYSNYYKFLIIMSDYTGFSSAALSLLHQAPDLGKSFIQMAATSQTESRQTIF